MSVERMREALIKRYNVVIQGRRVDCMPDRQVIAIYRSMIKREGRASKGPGIPSKRRIHEPIKFEQMRMDFMYD